MKILALDLSLTAPGYCNETGPATIKVPAGWRGMERLEHIRVCVAALADDADLVVIEGYSYGSKGQAVVNIGELGGVIRHYLHQERIPYVDIPPSCLKKYLCGKGNASKDDVLQQAVVRSGRTFIDNNAADAWGLWQMAMAHYDPSSPLLAKVPALNRKALEKIRWEE